MRKWRKKNIWKIRSIDITRDSLACKKEEKQSEKSKENSSGIIQKR